MWCMYVLYVVSFSYRASWKVYIDMYVCMYVFTYSWEYLCIYVCTMYYSWVNVCMFDVCMYVCMHSWVYVYMCVCIHVYQDNSVLNILKLCMCHSLEHVWKCMFVCMYQKVKEDKAAIETLQSENKVKAEQLDKIEAELVGCKKQLAETDAKCVCRWSIAN